MLFLLAMKVGERMKGKNVKVYLGGKLEVKIWKINGRVGLPSYSILKSGCNIINTLNSAQ